MKRKRLLLAMTVLILTIVIGVSCKRDPAVSVKDDVQSVITNTAEITGQKQKVNNDQIKTAVDTIKVAHDHYYYLSGDFGYRFASVNIDGTKTIYAVITGYYGSDEDIVLPDSIEGYKVGDIIKMEQSSRIKSVTLGKYIGEFCFEKGSAFSAPQYLGQIDGLEEIKVSPQNPYLVSENGILYSNDMKTLFACPGNITVKKLDIPESVEEIYNGSFDGNKTIEELTINGKEIKEVAEAFNEMKELKKILITGIDKLSSCGDDCPKLREIILQKDVKYIGDCFNRLEKLESISLPDSLERIEGKSFSDCGNLEMTEIPESVQFISSSSFVDSSGKRTELSTPGYIDSGVMSYDKEAYNAYFVADERKHAVSSLDSISVKDEILYLKTAEVQIELIAGCKPAIFDKDAGEHGEYYYYGDVTEYPVSEESLSGGLFTFETDSPDIVDVSDAGVLKPVSAGEANITVGVRSKADCRVKFKAVVLK